MTLVDERDIRTEIALFGAAYVYVDQEENEYLLDPENVKIYTSEDPEGKAAISSEEAKQIRYRFMTDAEFAAEIQL